MRNQFDIVIITTNYTLGNAFRTLFKLYTDQIKIVREIPNKYFNKTFEKEQLFIFEYPLKDSSLRFLETAKDFDKINALILAGSKDIEKASIGQQQSTRYIIETYEVKTHDIINKIKLHPTLGPFTQTSKDDYFKIHKKILSNLDDGFTFNIYLEYSKNRFTRIYNPQLVSSIDTLKKYINDRDNSFYVLGEDEYFKYTQRVLNKVISQQKHLQAPKKTLDSIGFKNSQEIVNQVSNLNMDQVTILKTDHSLSNSVSQIEKSAKLFNQLKKINSCGDFLSEHNIMLSFVTSAITCELEIKDQNSYDKLTLACLLHDISLEDSQENIKDIHHQDISKLSISYKNHPNKSIEYLEKIPNISPDTFKIILQHHEKQDGDGFPKGIDFKHISLLSAIFIVAEDFVLTIYEKELNPETFQEVRDSFSNKYTKSNFRLVYTALCKVLAKSQNLLFD